MMPLLLLLSVLVAPAHSRSEREPLQQSAAIASTAHYNVQNFGAIGDGRHDDTDALQRAFNAVRNGGSLVFPNGSKRYRIAKTLVLGGDGVTVDGNGATLVASLDRRGDVLQNEINSAASGLAMVQDVGARADRVTTADLSRYRVRSGDICLIRTSKGDPLAQGYELGTLRRIAGMSGATLLLDGPVTTSYSVVDDRPTVSIYHPQHRLTIRHLNIELQKDLKQTGARLRYLDHALLEDLAILGGGESDAGLVVTEAFDTQVVRVTAQHFRDRDYHFGYGVQVAGHDITIRDSSISDAKHGLTCGHNNYRSSRVVYQGNRTSDAMLDAHGTCENVRMVENVIMGVGSTSGRYAAGIFVRGHDMDISNNTIRCVDQPVMPTEGIRILEVAVDGISVGGNTIVGCTADAIAAHYMAGPAVHFKIVGNRLTGSGIRLKDVSDSVVSRNIVDSTASGISIVGGDHVEIAFNEVRFARKSFGVGIYLDESAGHVSRGMSIHDNTLEAAGRGANSAIRVRRGYDRFTISDNAIEMHGAAAAPIQISEDADCTESSLERNAGDTRPRGGSSKCR